MLARLFEQFIKERVYLKNITPATEAWHRNAWKMVSIHLPAQDVDALTKDNLQSAVFALRDKGVSAISVNTYLRSVNAFLRWLHLEGKLAQPVKVQKQREEQKIIATFSVAQVDRLLGWKGRGFGQRRMYALVALLLDTGLRIDEALTLRREGLDFDNLLVRVTGKGRKDRMVPMSFGARKVLWRWLQSHEFDGVFPTRNGTRYRYRNAQRDFAALCRRLGFEGVRCSFHTLRHTFAVNYLRNGGNVFYLQRILGHTTLEMTNRYVRSLGIEDLQAVHDRLSLLAKA